MRKRESLAVKESLKDIGVDLRGVWVCGCVGACVTPGSDPTKKDKERYFSTFLASISHSSLCIQLITSDRKHDCLQERLYLAWSL